MLNKTSRTEIKVRAAALATFAVTTVGGILLQTSATEWAKDLPVWLQVPASALILSGVSWLAGRQAKSRPDYLSPSTIAAAETWVRQHAPKPPRDQRFN